MLVADGVHGVEVISVLATGPRRVMSADAPLKHGLRGLAHDGACVLRLLGNRSDRPLQDVAVSPGHGSLLCQAASATPAAVEA
jgi:hypothetical protein